MIRYLIHNLTESVRKILASGVGAIVATTINSLTIESGTTTGTLGGVPAQTVTYTRLGSFYVASGAGVPTSIDLPRGSFYLNTSAVTLYRKYNTAATEWTLIQDAGGAVSATTVSTNGFVFLNANSYLSITEMTAPPTPVANRATVWAEDNGAGKTRLMVQFGTGVAIPLSIEL